METKTKGSHGGPRPGSGRPKGASGKPTAVAKINSHSEKPLPVEAWPVARPQPYPGNPRRIGDLAVAKVAALIREFGFRQPIVVDGDGVMIAGHTRLMAARSLGLATVPGHIARELTPEQARAYRLADNRSGQEAEWDNDRLRDEFLALAGLDIDLSLTAFDPDEIAALSAAPGHTGLVDPDEAPELPAQPISASGDLWALGRHRLLCGDATKAEDTHKVLAGVAPHLMVTDPPYGVNYDPNWRNEAAINGATYGRARGVIGGRAVGKVSNDDRVDWRDAWGLFAGDVGYVWHGATHTSEVQQSLESVGFTIRSQIIWAKNNMVISRGDYHFKHEPCWYAVRAGKTGHWQGDRTQTSLWEIEKPQKSETGHSTQKPVECMKRPIENNSSPGQAVYDPFVGSGTSIIAAEMTGRCCYAIEIDPGYCDVAVLRWQTFTGEKATLDGDGRDFATVAAERVRDAA